MEDNKARNEENDIDIKEYLQILWRGKWIILACIVIAGILGFMFSSNAIPIYRAEAKLPSRISPPNYSGRRKCSTAPAARPISRPR